MINGTCASRPFKFGTFGHKACDDLDIKMKSARHPWALGAPLVAIEFQATARPAQVFQRHLQVPRRLGRRRLVVRGNYVFDRKSGPTHRLDLTFKEIGNAAARSLPHGIIGQSFTTNAPRRGKQDVYPASGRFATSAQAEGAIEGDASMYEVPFPHATTFAFSRFMSAALADGDF